MRKYYTIYQSREYSSAKLVFILIFRENDALLKYALAVFMGTFQAILYYFKSRLTAVIYSPCMK